MADGDTVSTPSKNGEDPKSVTIPAFKYELMLRVIGQFQQGKSINWSTIHSGHKARKTLSNMWVKVRAEIAALDPPVEEGAATHTPKSAKKRCVKQAGDVNESDASPKKKPRRTVAAAATPPKIKEEEDSEVKGEPIKEEGD